MLGNFIGTDVSGMARLPNEISGVKIRDAENNAVGGTAVGAGNVISGNLDHGVELDGGDGNIVQGNLIGTDVTGLTPSKNGGDSVRVSGGMGNLIGGPTAGAANVISGNSRAGVSLAGAGNMVQGNLIGTDVTGLALLPNSTVGVSISGAGHTIGGNPADAGNLISGNDGWGIDSTSRDTTISGNLIGTDATGTAPLPNTSGGITTAGDDGSITGNTIAFNRGDAVRLETIATGVLIRDNSIHSNTGLGKGLGIDLGGDWITFNDDDDSDSGANLRQNFPTITSALTDSLAEPPLVRGTFQGAANTDLIVDVDANSQCDFSWYGEGERPLGWTIIFTDADGAANFQLLINDPVAAGEFVTATAIGDNNTSEFSRCREVLSPNVPAAELNLRCTASPVWPQEGEFVTITAEAFDGALNPVIFADNLEIWANGRDAPRVSGPSTFGTETWILGPVGVGDFSYGCRVQDGSGTVFTGWRTAATGVSTVFRAVPILISAEKVT